MSGSDFTRSNFMSVHWMGWWNIRDFDNLSIRPRANLQMQKIHCEKFYCEKNNHLRHHCQGMNTFKDFNLNFLKKIYEKKYQKILKKRENYKKIQEDFFFLNSLHKRSTLSCSSIPSINSPPLDISLFS
jgi:hypothetical protein